MIITSDYKWLIRQPKPSDISFIYDSWLKCYRFGSALGKSCRTTVFFDEYKIILDHILNNPSSTIKVACLPDEQDIIIGYLIATQPILHWCFVKEAFRNFGIAKALYLTVFNNTTDQRLCSHKTFLVEALLNNHKQLEFNPFVLYQKESS